MGRWRWALGGWLRRGRQPRELASGWGLPRGGLSSCMRVGPTKLFFALPIPIELERPKNVRAAITAEEEERGFPYRAMSGVALRKNKK